MPLLTTKEQRGSVKFNVNSEILTLMYFEFKTEDLVTKHRIQLNSNIVNKPLRKTRFNGRQDIKILISICKCCSSLVISHSPEPFSFNSTAWYFDYC